MPKNVGYYTAAKQSWSTKLDQFWKRRSENDIHMAIFHLKRSNFATLDSQSQQGGPRAPTESGQLGATKPSAKQLITSAGPLLPGDCAGGMAAEK